MNKTKLLPLALLGALSAGSAEAAISWTFSSAACNGSWQTNCSETSGGETVGVTAWANTAGTSSSTSNALESASLRRFGGGYGVRNRDYPGGPGDASSTDDNNEGSSSSPYEHAIDNDQRIDSVLFTFDSSNYQLTSLTTDWVSGDSDLSVLAYTGTGVPVLIGKTYGGLLSNGWTLIGNYNGDSSAPNTYSIASAVQSSYWLVTAYTSVFGTTSNNGGTVDGGDDKFKISGISGNEVAAVTAVPLPATAWLLGLGLPLMAALRRRVGV